MTAPVPPVETELLRIARETREALEGLYGALAQYFDGKGGMLELTAATRRAEIVLGLRVDEK